jgi:SAM-dependent methyltransferase
VASEANILYDTIGEGYAALRQTDPRIADQLWAALGDAETVLNVGAGAGSYEPPGREVVAVEPSEVMRRQRPPTAARCVAGTADALPFGDQSFDVAMAVLSDHHWPDPLAGLREMQRVARRVVVLQWDSGRIADFWLVRDYLPEFVSLAMAGPTLKEKARLLEASVQVVPIPWDCHDGFFHAFWRRPQAYLDPAVRQASSPWAQVGRAVEDRAVAALAADLATGLWQQRNSQITDLESIDLGARLLISAGV